MSKHQITNTSASHLNINGVDLAPTAHMQVDVVDLQLRSFEEQGFLKIEAVIESVPQPKKPSPAVTPPMATKPEPKFNKKGYRRN